MGRQRYSAEFKAKVALEALRGLRTANEIAAEFGLHPNQISQWKKQALESLPDVFRHPGNQSRNGEAALKDRLYEVDPYSWTLICIS